MSDNVNPEISVILSVFNGVDYVGATIDSLLAQTYQNFELIVVDDGSTDDTPAVLTPYDDPRVRVYRQKNIGLTATLNKAVGLCRGRFIARIDADEEAMPDRLARQVAFLEEHPNIALVGSYCRNIDLLSNRTETVKVPIEHGDIRRGLLRANAFVHGSVMMRREVFDVVGQYNEQFKYVQDYEFWGRIAAKCRTHNLPEILLTRKMTHGSLSNNRSLLKERALWDLKAQLSVLQHLSAPWYAYRFLWWRAFVYVLFAMRIVRSPIKGRRGLLRLILPAQHASRPVSP